jgi:hypothetical protein
MLSMRQLHAFAEALGETPALTVYGSSRYEDPTSRREWRVALDAELKRITNSLTGAPHAERMDYARAAEFVNGILAAGAIPESALGWVIVATADRVVLAEPIAAFAPVAAFWRPGMMLAPFARTLAAGAGALVVVADGRSVRLLRFANERLSELETLHALTISRPSYHMSAPPRRGFHGGTRGTTGRDAAERDRRAARGRMIRQAAARLAVLCEASERILLGGIPQAATAIQDALPGELVARSRVIALDVHAGDAAMREAARRAVHEAREEEERVVVTEVLAARAQGSKAVIGVGETLRRLEEGAVARLVMTERFLRDRPDDAERLVRAALAQHASLGIAPAGVADVLDEEGEGVGGTLRFVPGLPAQTQPAVASAPVSA